ncbi:hypothetical protein FHX10_004550 [Rhizobium sp. BK591]|nr:hypothetical protein [Rhizobium sp. BK591]
MSDKMSLVHYLRDDRAEATIELHQNGVRRVPFNA